MSADKILRFFEVETFASGLPDPATYDGFVYGHVGVREPEVAGLIAAGKRCLRYFNVLQWPRDEWHNEWFDYVRSTVVPLRALNGKLAYFPWFGQTLLWDWSIITQQRVKSIARKMATLANVTSGAGIFLDQFWCSPRPWMFAETGPSGEPGAAYTDFPATKWLRWEAMLRHLVTCLWQFGASVVVPNGDRNAPAPIHLEHPEWYPMEHELELWREHPDSILSPYADDWWTVEWGLGAWHKSGKWLGFTGHDQVAVERAYAEAHRWRSQP